MKNDRFRVKLDHFSTELQLHERLPLIITGISDCSVDQGIHGRAQEPLTHHPPSENGLFHDQESMQIQRVYRLVR